MKTVLGIETSCDETAAAVVREDGAILSNVVVSQLEDHRPFGGVVPEIAARSHLDHLSPVVGQAMREAGLDYADLDAVAATAGPGLIGGVIVGATAGKTIALGAGLPFIAVNHLEAHALTARLASGDDSGDVCFPYLLLLVSGGHCQLLSVQGVGAYRLYGATLDDAIGEAFDKTAKLLGLRYPGGPAVEQAARNGDPCRFALPRPMVGRTDLNFSFAGLKTAVRQTVERETQGGSVSVQLAADLSAGFQAAAGEVLQDRCRRALARFRSENPDAAPMLVVAGGVAANKHLRAVLETLCRSEGARFAAPPLALCTDNGAMVAWAGLERLREGLIDDLGFKPRPRWPLDPDAVIKKGAGAHGV